MSPIAAASVTTVDPASGRPLRRYPSAGPEEIELCLQRSDAAGCEWRRTPISERAAGLHSIGSVLLHNRDRAAALITAEMGKPLREARQEIDKSIRVCEHYAECGERMLKPQHVATDWAESYVQFPPLGTVLAIMPWNYPFWQVLRAAAPALMAGNAVVLKHASSVTGCALLLEALIAEAAVPAGLLQSVVLPAADIEQLLGDPRVAAVSLTGSDATGVAVAHLCARHLKKSVLELGGSDPFIVLDDADVEAAAAAAVIARFQNAGQSCIAAKRFLVADAIAGEFEERLAAGAAALRVGNPTDPDVDMGPMARIDLRDQLAEQVRAGLEAGAQLLTGGIALDRPGAYHPATVVVGVNSGNPLFREETFGPAAAVTRFRDRAHAIALANQSHYGLSCSIWTAEPEAAQLLAAEVEAGAVFVNAISASDPRMPFGGLKRSGWGRELGAWGIHEFVNIQGVTVGPRQAG